VDKLFAPIFQALSFGPLRFILIAISFVTIAAAAITMLLEIAGYRISRSGLRKTDTRWDATSIALVAICGAVYTGARFLQTPQIVPGFGGLTFTHVLAPVMALLFGIPGAVGVSLSVPFGDYLFGYLSVGSVSGVAGHWMALTYIPLLMIKNPSMRNRSSVISVYIWAVIIASFWHSITIDGWLDALRLVPTEVAWGVIAPGVVVAHGLIPAILMPFVLTPLYPAIKAMGLYWRDRVTKVVPSAAT
jgi:energy-coupling factor transport system substrate-specific component